MVAGYLARPSTPACCRDCGLCACCSLNPDRNPGKVSGFRFRVFPSEADPAIYPANLAGFGYMELIALAKARAGQLTYASTGVGSASHLTMELFKLASGIAYIHVPYKGSANTVPDLIGGHVDMTTSSIIALLPHIKAARIRALGITSPQRSPVAPELPTLAESGYPGFEAETWAAMLGPAGMPAPIVALLNATIAKIVKMPDIAERIAAQGAAPRMGTPDQARAFIKAELAKWEKVVAAAGIRAE